MVQPIATPCGHRFCKSCLVRASEAIEDLTCPMCRGNLETFDIEGAVVDEPLANRILGAIASAAYRRRITAADKWFARRDACTSQDFVIGNRHSLITSRTGHNQHRWEIFLRTGGGPFLNLIADKVTFHLHETFGGVPVVIRPGNTTMTRNGEISFTRRGWGTFVIRIEIHLKRKYRVAADEGRVVHTSWELDFDRDENYKRISTRLISL